MGVKISELNEALSVQNSDVLPIVQDGETKKIPVGTLGSQKVNKSGDTLTGSLYFNNADTYDAIRKKRTIDGVDYELSVGLGGNKSARMELVGTNNIVLSSVEARNDGVYNGKTGNKLVETKSQIEYNNWQSVVLTRSDTNTLYVILYGSNHLKEGSYSIANNFKLVTYGTTYSELTIPKSALNTIYRRDWGFELTFNRSSISGISSGQYNGVAVPYDGPLILQAT